MNSQVRTVTRFAWLPVRVEGQRIWLRTYLETQLKEVVDGYPSDRWVTLNRRLTR